MMRERRAAPRLDEETPALYAPNLCCKVAQRARIRNIGEEGACLIAAEALEVGSELNLSFFLGIHPHPVVVLSRVIWSKAEGDRFAMGLAFAPDGAGQVLAVQRIAEYVRAARAAAASPA